MFVFAACGTSDNERRTTLLTETVIEPAEDDVADMDSGMSVFFPAGTFSENTIILISDALVGEEIDAALFPTDAQTILASIVLNSPVDTIFRKNVTFTWFLLAEVAPGSTWRIFRFNDYYEEPEDAWVELQGITAMVNESGDFATSVMPSSGVTGYSGSFALFFELPADASPNIPPEFGPDGLQIDTEPIVSGEPITISCAVTDADGDLLAFTWNDGSDEHGTFSNQSYAEGVVSIEWVTDVPGEYVIELTVEDGSGVMIKGSLEIEVVAAE